MNLGYPGLPRAWRGDHVRIARFEKGPVAVIGDIHGPADLLRALLDRLGDIPILVVGDVCDRGPDTRGCSTCSSRGVRSASWATTTCGS